MRVRSCKTMTRYMLDNCTDFMFFISFNADVRKRLNCTYFQKNKLYLLKLFVNLYNLSTTGTVLILIPTDFNK